MMPSLYSSLLSWPSIEAEPSMNTCQQKLLEGVIFPILFDKED